MKNARQYLQSIKRLGLLFNEEDQLNEITGAKDLDKAQNCDEKFAMLCHEVTKYSRDMGMEISLRDLLDDYEIAVTILKDVNETSHNLIPKILLLKGRRKAEETAYQLLDCILYESNPQPQTTKLKYNTLQDVAEAIKNGLGQDDEYMDYEFRILQRTVITTLILIGVLPQNKNSEPKDIKGDDKYAYQFFNKYIVEKLPESNLNIANFEACELWKDFSDNKMPDTYDKEDCLYCHNRLNIISFALHTLAFFLRTIVNPEKMREWNQAHIINTIPDGLSLSDPEDNNCIYGIFKTDDIYYELAKFEIIESDEDNPRALSQIAKTEKTTEEIKSLKAIIKELRGLKKLKDKILITPKLDRIKGEIGSWELEIKDQLLELTSQLYCDAREMYNILDNKSDWFAEINQACDEQIEWQKWYLEELQNHKKISHIQATRYMVTFQMGNDNLKYCIILKPNNDLKPENYRCINATLTYSIDNEELNMIYYRSTEGTGEIPEWLQLPSTDGIISLKIDDDQIGRYNFLSSFLEVRESNNFDWASIIYCDTIHIVTADYIYCKIDDSKQYYRIKRKGNSISNDFKQLLPDDTLLICRMKEASEKLLLSVPKILIDLKDITHNPDFEIVDNVEI